MSDYKLSTFVHAVELDQDGKQTGRTGTFGPDSDLTGDNSWVLDAVSNPDVWAGDKPPLRTPPIAQPAGPAGEATEVALLRARIAELEASKNTPPAGADLALPPLRGTGSGAPEWRAYARSKQVDVEETASRDEAIAALEAAGHATK